MKRRKLAKASGVFWGLGIGILVWGHAGFSQISQERHLLRLRVPAEPKGFSPFPLPLNSELQALLDSTSRGSVVFDLEDMDGDGDLPFLRFPLVHVQGTVYGEGGKPEPRVEIVIRNLDSVGSYRITSDKYGRYSYVGLPPGDYLMVVVYKGEAGLGRALPLTKTRDHITTHVDFFLKEFKSVGEEAIVLAVYKRKSRSEVWNADAESPEMKLPDPYRERYERALKLADEGLFALAKVALKGLIEENGNIAVFHYRLGQIHSYLRDYSDAAAEFEKAMALTPEEPAYPALVCYNLLLASKDFGVAEAMAERAANLDRSVGGEAYYNLALTLTDQGDSRRAESAFRRAAELSPDFSR